MTPTAQEVANWSVNDVVRQFPATVALFKHYGIDACCGGAASVRDAAQRHGADAAELLSELQQMIADRIEEGDACSCQCSVTHTSRPECGRLFSSPIRDDLGNNARPRSGL